MPTTERLLSLMADHESDRVERTVSTNNTDKFGEAICAFANDFPGNGQPGYLLVGVQDGGALDGLEVTDRILLRLGDLRSNVNLVCCLMNNFAVCGSAFLSLASAPKPVRCLAAARHRRRLWPSHTDLGWTNRRRSLRSRRRLFHPRRVRRTVVGPT